ncbi:MULTISPECIES: ABC transporter ATP-binding protein [Prevotellaceae]|jgi:ABC-2 type transport system ATP-binding protein|uniref:ABC transporter ATP-binding protein n=1 Tax=Leyella stercorea TaxID=363265 RepID=UPI001F1DE766|nr:MULTISPECIES: ABC transporter ATP-binding protein [Prevotellaceae]MCF2644023.1 ABC transporter ATP-binding protein [Leyella stercorea]MCI6130006.1 ABC transporter ATP-binding protein [Prevotella sp.]MCI7371098.1 ABC transporter ATP-binding protein [Prevotella sp.]MDD6198648.1 ABC transporter ATP-binding protein [Prevotella sp.]MDY3967810.1 ABC transporter ATP-binding protein [Prevotella sp.]
MRIQLNNLKKCFGEHTAVDIPHFTIDNGQMVGLVGNNGAGKTTLFRLMLDLSKATEGNVLIDDIDPAKSEDWKLQTGAFIDNSFLIDFLTAEEYFEFVGKVSGMTREQVAERLKTFETFMGDEIMGQKKYIRDFSAGNKQKIGIVAALLSSPQLVILDEPFNFLDPSSQNQLKRILTEFNRSTGSTVIVSSHNLQHTVDISTRVALLEKGKIIEDIDNSDGKAEEILDKYFNL